MKNQKGITLVALVITVIVMLILAGVTINMTLGERGIFNTAASTKEKQEIAEYLEKIELSRVEVASKNMGKVTLDNLIDQIVEDKIVTRERITKINVDGEEKAKMITKEGYNFIITADKAEYAGKGDVIPTPPTLQEGDIQVTLTPTTWTNDKVTVEIKTKVEGNYTIQYSLDDGTTWKDYTTTFEVSENKTIWACLRNALGEKGNYTTFKVDKIDKLAPVQFTPNTSKTTNSITIDASGAKDAEATSTNGKSGIKEIWYSNDDGTTWKINENKTDTTYTFNNLTQGQPYKIKVKVVDNAGNQTITATKEETTGTVTSGLQEGAITFSINPTGWTNQDVTVTGATNTSYTLQLSTTENFPNNTNEVKSVTVSGNQTVYARLIDSTMQYNGTASYKVDKIDKLPPVQFTPTTTKTTNSITVNANGAKDAEATTTNGKSEIKEIWYSNDDGTTWKINSNKTQTTYTFNNLTQGQTYKIKVKVIDNAGNQTITVAKEETTGTVTSGVQEGAITFSINPTGWTNKDVTVTGATNTSYTLQLSTSTTFPNNTNEVKSVTVSENQTVYARLIDSTMQYNGTASYKVDKIDKQKPVVGTLTPTPTSIRITAIDEASGIVGYAVTTNTTQPITFTGVNNTKTLDTTVTGRNQNTTYYVWVKDQAGNVSAYSTTKTTTQPVTSISVTPTSATLKPNETVQLSANVQPNDAYNKAYTWKSGNESIATVSSTGLVTAKAAGSVTITATANDGSGKSGSATITVANTALANKITAANYGDYVNYPAANGSTSKGHTTDWRIFYKDDDGYVYLISSYYLQYSQVPSGTNLQAYTDRPYTSYWTTASYTEIAQATYDRYKMNFKYNGSPNNNQPNMKCVSQLMNTSVWSKFVNSNYAIDAIGAPTLEMWVESWNAKGNTKLYYDNTNSNGYYVGTSSKPTSTYVSGLPTTNTLYFPVTSSTYSGANGYHYWLASPSADSSINLMFVNYGGHVYYGPYSSPSLSVRPLVRLKSDVSGELVNGIWNLK